MNPRVLPYIGGIRNSLKLSPTTEAQVEQRQRGRKVSHRSFENNQAGIWTRNARPAFRSAHLPGQNLAPDIAGDAETRLRLLVLYVNILAYGSTI